MFEGNYTAAKGGTGPTPSAVSELCSVLNMYARICCPHMHLARGTFDETGVKEQFVLCVICSHEQTPDHAARPSKQPVL